MHPSLRYVPDCRDLSTSLTLREGQRGDAPQAHSRAEFRRNLVEQMAQLWLWWCGGVQEVNGKAYFGDMI